LKNKVEKHYVCDSCGYESKKWFAKCPSCNSLDSVVEFNINTASKKSQKNSSEESSISYIEDDFVVPEKINTSIKELNKTLKGGLVQGGVYLLSGEPGIGKSTLVSQLSSGFDDFCLYVSGEESKEQVIQRFKRLEINNKNIGLMFENDVENIMYSVERYKSKPKVIFIDSIQTLKSDNFDSISGSVTQIKECSKKLTEFAKKNNITVFLIGHVNKEGSIAGPKLLEHVVDCVMHFEIEKSSGLRMLRIIKNRFGPTDEIILFEMKEKGIFPVENITEYFISDYSNEPGNVLSVVKEGSKLIPIEIQALVGKPVYSTSRLITTGIPNDRAVMICAVMSKKLKIAFEAKDIFLNTSGGFKTNDSSIDLAIALAIFSSFLDKPFPNAAIGFGEIGLDGKIRNTSLIEKRIELSEKIGIKNIIVPEKVKYKSNQLIKISNITDLINYFRG
jgi:DNA repair protein RadA/Sms